MQPSSKERTLQGWYGRHARSMEEARKDKATIIIGDSIVANMKKSIGIITSIDCSNLVFQMLLRFLKNVRLAPKNGGALLTKLYTWYIYLFISNSFISNSTEILAKNKQLNWDTPSTDIFSYRKQLLIYNSKCIFKTRWIKSCKMTILV